MQFVKVQAGNSYLRVPDCTWGELCPLLCWERSKGATTPALWFFTVQLGTLAEQQWCPFVTELWWWKCRGSGTLSRDPGPARTCLNSGELLSWSPPTGLAFPLPWPPADSSVLLPPVWILGSFCPSPPPAAGLGLALPFPWPSPLSTPVSDYTADPGNSLLLSLLLSSFYLHHVHSSIHHQSGCSSPVPSNQAQILYPHHMTLSPIFLSRLRSPSENSLIPRALATCQNPAASNYFCTFAHPLFFPSDLGQKVTFLHDDGLPCFAVPLTPPPCHSLCRTLSASLPLLANFDFSLCTCCTGMHAHVLDSIWRYPFQILSFPSPSNYHFLTVLTKPMHRWKHPIFIWQCVGNLSKGHQTCVSLWLHFFFPDWFLFLFCSDYYYRSYWWYCHQLFLLCSAWWQISVGNYQVF